MNEENWQQLDALLRSARWPGEEDEQVAQAAARILARAEQADKQPSTNPSVWWVAAVAVAAVVLIAGQLLFAVPSFTPSPHPTAIIESTAKPKPSEITAATDTREIVAAPVQATKPSYPPAIVSEEELLAMVLWHSVERQRRERDMPLSAAASAWNKLQQWGSIADRRVQEARETRGPALPELAPQWSASAEKLLWRLSQSKAPLHRATAVWGLGVVGSRRSLSLLHLMLDDPATRTIACVSLVRLASVAEIKTVLDEEKRPAVRLWLLASLARTGGDHTDLFLDLVYQRTTRVEALTSLRLVPNLSATPLITRLRGNDWQRSRAAALALAATPSNDAAVQLQRTLQDDVANVHLWMALIARPEPTIQQLVARLSTDSRFESRIQFARSQLFSEMSF